MQHHLLTRQAIIDWLVNEKCNDISSDALVTGVFSTDWTDEGFGAFAFRKDLAECSDEELEVMFREKLTKHQQILQNARDNNYAGLFFNKPGAFADFGFAARQLVWTLEEAVALSLGRRPDVLNSSRLVNDNAGASKSDLGREYFARLEIGQNWIRAGQLEPEATAGEMLAWLRRAQLDFSDDLLEAVTRIGHQVADWKTEYDDQLAINAELEDENAGLQQTAQQWAAMHAELTGQHREEVSEIVSKLEEAETTIRMLKASAETEPQRAQQAEDESLDPRERTSLYKILLAIAVEKYRFDPSASQSAAPGNIAGTTERVGLNVSTKTIRRYLDAAAPLLPAKGL